MLTSIRQTHSEFFRQFHNLKIMVGDKSITLLSRYARKSSFDYVEEQENQIYTKIKNLWGVTLPKLLLAESDEEFDQIMEDFKKQREDIGFEQVQKASTVQIHDNMEKLGIEQ